MKYLLGTVAVSKKILGIDFDLSFEFSSFRSRFDDFVYPPPIPHRRRSASRAIDGRRRGRRRRRRKYRHFPVGGTHQGDRRDGNRIQVRS